MKMKTEILLALILLFLAAMTTGCVSAKATPASTATGEQLANPWVEATPVQAAVVLGGTFYNMTTLGNTYEQYALLVSTNAAIASGMKPSAMVRWRKGDEDVTLTMQKGATLSPEQLKGKQVSVNGNPGYITDNADGTAQIAWEANGLLMDIQISTTWGDDALVALAQGVKIVG